MKSSVVKRSIVIANHKTSISLELEFWVALKEIARRFDATLSDIVGQIDIDRNARKTSNLSSSIRVFVLGHYRERAEAESGAHDVADAGSAHVNGV